MNQEKIMKAKMISAFVIALISVVGVFVFAGLYTEKSKEIQRTYREKYIENVQYASDEIQTYLTKKKDYEIRYNMILSDMGAARNLIFLIDGKEKEQNVFNELHYCFVKYPQQMKDKLQDVKKALDDIGDNLDKGYDEAEKIVDSVDKMGK